MCKCTEYYTGPTCEEDVNECEDVNFCQYGGTCSVRYTIAAVSIRHSVYTVYNDVYNGVYRIADNVC